MIRLVVHARPKGQERARHAVRTTATGRRYAVTYTPQATRLAAAQIHSAWVASGSERVPDGVAFRVSVIATMRRPDSHTRKDGSPSSQYREVPVRPDIDNVLKLVLDALQPDCFANDAMCVEATISKRYGSEDSTSIQIEWA